MAANEYWTCFECSQSFETSQAFCECTHCRVRFCFSCQTKHPQQHAEYLVTVQKFPSYGVGDTAQQCVSCRRFATCHYDCQACFLSQCITCWRAFGINRHNHRAFILHELRQDYNLGPQYNHTTSNTHAHGPYSRHQMPPYRSQSTSAAAATTVSPPIYTPPPLYSGQRNGRQSVPTFSPPQYPAAALRQTQSHTVQPTPPAFGHGMYPSPSTSPNQPQPAQRKRDILTRGAKKAYAMSQKNTLTRVGTRVALTVVGGAVGADIAGLVDGIGGLDFGGVGDSANVGAADTSSLNNTAFSDQNFADTGTLPNGGDVGNGGQDFSNLPNGAPETTAWMQQQYWQNITLPNLAGPTMTPAQLYVG